jgi:hypothetical protein
LWYFYIGKGIKKIADILFRVVATIVFIVVLLFLLLQLSSVQNYLAHKGAEYLSKKLKTKVEIGSIELSFYKRIIVNDIYLEDLHNDTLFYAKKLNLGIGEIDSEKRTIEIRNVGLLSGKSKIIKYATDDDFNMQFIIDAFDDGDTTKHTKKAPWKLTIGEVTCVNVDFSYKNEHDTLHTTGINFFDLRAQSINGRFSDINIVGDTIRATIDYLAAKEKSGFVIKNLSSYVKVSPLVLQLDELKLRTPESDIKTDLTFSYTRWRDYMNFIHNVRIKADFDHSQLEMSDIAYFASELKGIYERLDITGKVSGKIDDLRGKDMDILLGNHTEFVGDLTLTGLPNIDETLIYLNVDKLTTDYNDLSQIPIPPFNLRKKLMVPKNIAMLGNISFKGTFTGLYNDFYAYGTFNSALGSVSTDIAVRHDEIKDKESYKGKIKSNQFDFGKFLGAPMLGKASVDATIDGEGFTIEDLKAKLEGKINSLDFNKYNYKNIAIEGEIAKQIFKGKLNVQDDNIDFDFIGKVDFNTKLPTLDFITTLNRADLAALNFVKTAKKTNLSTQIIINVVGDNIDNLVGQMNFDNTIYEQDNERYKMSVFNLIAEQENNQRSIKLFSDFADATIKGKFKILDLPLSIENILTNYLPNYFTKTNNIQNQNFDYKVNFKKTDPVTKLFIPNVKIAPKTFINGAFNSSSNEVSLAGNSSKLTISGIDFINLKTEANTTNQKLQIITACDQIILSDSVSMNNFILSTNTLNDSVNVALSWDNKSQRATVGDIKAFLHFNNDKTIKFKILPSQFIVADSVWAINKTNEVIIDSTHIQVKELTVEHENQSILMNGNISEVRKDELKLYFSDFNLSNLNPFLKPFGVTLKGRLNGQSSVYDLYKSPIFISDNTFSKLLINGNELGDGNVASLWDNAKEALYLNGKFTLNTVPNILFSGYYYPKKKEENIDMELNLQSIQLKLFEPFVKKYCSDFVGDLDANVSIRGAVNKPLLFGTAHVNAKKITVSYLKTSYKFSHDITIDNNSFAIENMSVSDANNNKAIVNGHVYHDNFDKFQLDFDINANKFMFLNTTEADNSLYYGTAFATGLINIFGFVDNNILIDANVKTEKILSADKSDKINVLSKTEMTKMFIPLSGPTEVSENNFITFVKKDTNTKNKDYNVRLDGIVLNFDLEVTPDAEIQLIFDQKVGDIIKAKGAGNIKLKISPTGDFKMYGDYIIENGDYLFTLQNIINKKFDIENGSTIKWSGIPYKADLNISALYKAKASIKPFFPNDSTAAYKKRYPVDLKLLMTDDLLTPDIAFDLNLPTIDPTIRQQVLSYMNTETEMNRQVFALLILNSFVTPSQLSGGGPDAVAAAGANAFELLSNQLSNMLSKISKDFDIGIKYRPGDAVSKDELGVAMSTQLFNDKLTIDGNLGVNNNNQNTNSIAGDVNIDYKLTDDGKVRIKAFNRANDNNLNYTYGPYTQGVGIFYREEFDSFKELRERYQKVIENRKKNKKTE